MGSQQRSNAHMPAATDRTSVLGDFPNAAEKSPGLSILVVDDEPLIRWSLTEALAGHGHHVVEAGDAQAAVQAMRASPEPFDVVLLDFRLPDSNDLSLLARLRLLAPASRIIMMTAFGAPEVLQGALALGAVQVVSKPFELDDLTDLVHPRATTPLSC
jgi:CheY-like chemotaxis protein